MKKTKIVQQGKTTRRRHICAFFIFTIHFCYSFYSKFNTDYLADAMENGSTALRQSWEGAAVSNRAYGRAWSGKQTMTNNNISTLSLTLHTQTHTHTCSANKRNFVFFSFCQPRPTQFSSMVKAFILD